MFEATFYIIIMIATVIRLIDNPLFSFGIIFGSGFRCDWKSLGWFILGVYALILFLIKAWSMQ